MSDALLRLAPDAPDGVVDVHVHVGPSDTGELYYPRLTGDAWLRLADEAGVAVACAFPPLRASYLQANRDLAEWAAGTGGKVLAFARLGGARVPVTLPALWQVRRAVNGRIRGRPSDLGEPGDLARFAGVKLLPHLDGVPADDELDAIDALRLPVVVHGGVHVPPAWIERHLVPRLRGPLIVAHLGAFPCDEGLVREAVELARRVEHVHLDTSGVWLADFLRYAADRVPHKLVFASDAPLTHPAVAWAHLAAAVHDDDVLADVAVHTPRRLLGLDPVGAP